MAAQLTVRPATEADLPAILGIYNEAILHTTATYDTEPVSLDERAAWLRERQAHALPVLVAEVRGVVVGFGALSRHSAKPGYRHTVGNSVYVEPASRGQGVGRAILAGLVRRAREAGVHVVLASIDAENEASLALHREFGFRKVAHLHEVGHKFGRWLDVIYMQLTIPAVDPLPRYRIRRPDQARTKNTTVRSAPTATTKART